MTTAIGSVGRIEKKKTKKKNHKKSQNRRPWYVRTTLKVNIHIFRLTKYTIYRKKCSCFFYAVTTLIFQMKIIFSSENWFNLVITFFFENAKNLGQSDDAKRRRKRDGLFVSKCKHALKMWGNQQVKPSLYHVISVFIFSFIQFSFRFYGFLQPTVLFDRLVKGSSVNTALIY